MVSSQSFCTPTCDVPIILHAMLPRLHLWEGDQDHGIHQLDPPRNLPEFTVDQIENYIDEYLDCIQEIALHRGRETTYQERFVNHYGVYQPLGYTGMIMMVHAFHYFLFLLQIGYPPEPIIQHFHSMFDGPSKYPPAQLAKYSTQYSECLYQGPASQISVFLCGHARDCM